MTMSTFEKVIGVAGMGTTLVNASLLKRFLSDVTMVVALTAISGTMVGMILIVGFYGLYLTLMHNGLQPEAAIFTVGGIVLVIAATLGGMAYSRFRQLRDLPGNMLEETPVIGHLSKLAEAFIDGLMTGRGRS
jgi:hypothetical protein